MPSTALTRNNVRIVGDGPDTLVLAHGFGTDQSAWHHQVPVFAKQYRVVLFDHVGAGSSDPAAYSPRRYGTLQSYASDMLEVFEALKLKDVLYVGHSMSGMIGVLAAIAEPEAFRRLVMIGASPRYLNDEGYTGGFDQPSLDGVYAAMASNYHAWASGFAGMAMGNPERPELSAEFARTLSSLRPDIALSVAKIIFQSDYRESLGKVSTPTLVLQTREDIAVPEFVGTFLASHIPGATLRMIDARGHLPHLSAPEAVNRAVLDYFAAPAARA